MFKNLIYSIAYIKRFALMSFMSIIIAIAPAYSHAVVPFAVPVYVGVAAATGVRYIAVEGGKQAVRKLTKEGITKLAKSSVGICVRNPLQCVGGAVTGLIASFGDIGLEVNVNDVDNTQINYDVDIYMESDKISNACYDVMYGGKTGNGYKDLWHSTSTALMSEIERNSNYAPNFKTTIQDSTLATAINKLKSTANSHDDDSTLIGGVIAYEAFKYDWVRQGTSFGGSENAYVNAVKKQCGGSSANPDSVNNTYNIDNSTVNNVINNYIDNSPDRVNLVKEIVSYDYSQYDGMTINNEVVNHGDIFNDYSDNSVNYNITNQVSQDIAAEKVDIEKVDDKVCHVNNDGDIDWCPGSTNDKPDDFEPDNSGGDGGGSENPYPNTPSTCSSNAFNQKICNFIDWVKNDNGVPSRAAEKVEVVDKTDSIMSSINDKMVIFPNQCPPPRDMGFTLAGARYEMEMKLDPLCQFFGMLRPFVVGLGGLTMSFIVMGIRRG